MEKLNPFPSLISLNFKYILFINIYYFISPKFQILENSHAKLPSLHLYNTKEEQVSIDGRRRKNFWRVDGDLINGLGVCYSGWRGGIVRNKWDIALMNFQKRRRGERKEEGVSRRHPRRRRPAWD